MTSAASSYGVFVERRTVLGSGYRVVFRTPAVPDRDVPASESIVYQGSSGEDANHCAQAFHSKVLTAYRQSEDDLFRVGPPSIELHPMEGLDAPV